MQRIVSNFRSVASQGSIGRVPSAFRHVLSRARMASTAAGPEAIEPGKDNSLFLRTEDQEAEAQDVQKSEGAMAQVDQVAGGATETTESLQLPHMKVRAKETAQEYYGVEKKRGGNNGKRSQSQSKPEQRQSGSGQMAPPQQFRDVQATTRTNITEATFRTDETRAEREAVKEGDEHAATKPDAAQPLATEAQPQPQQQANEAKEKEKQQQQQQQASSVPEAKGRQAGARASAAPPPPLFRPPELTRRRLGGLRDLSARPQLLHSDPNVRSTALSGQQLLRHSVRDHTAYEPTAWLGVFTRGARRSPSRGGVEFHNDGAPIKVVGEPDEVSVCSWTEKRMGHEQGDVLCDVEYHNDGAPIRIQYDFLVDELSDRPLTAGAGRQQRASMAARK